MIKNVKLFFIVFLILSFSRLIPHPPNFTSLVALSFYIPILFGINYIFFVLLSFVLTDLIIGFHQVLFFTWSSVIVIGFIANYFRFSVSKRFSGSLLSAIIFFLITNFGVWLSGYYGYSFNGLIECYTLALPFFAYTLISTIILCIVFETILKLKKLKSNKIF